MPGAAPADHARQPAMPQVLADYEFRIVLSSGKHAGSLHDQSSRGQGTDLSQDVRRVGNMVESAKTQDDIKGFAEAAIQFVNIARYKARHRTVGFSSQRTGDESRAVGAFFAKFQSYHFPRAGQSRFEGKCTVRAKQIKNPFISDLGLEPWPYHLGFQIVVGVEVTSLRVPGRDCVAKGHLREPRFRLDGLHLCLFFSTEIEVKIQHSGRL